MNEPTPQDKIRIATQIVPLAKSSKNPWGDFGRIAIITFQSRDKRSMVSKYFKIVDETHHPIEMTEEEFKDACVQTLLANSGLPTLVEM